MQIGDYQVPDKNRKLSISTRFDSESLGGETSGTEAAHNGIKPKELTCTFVVPFDTPAEITAFYALAEATDDVGDLVVYELVEPGANAANIRQVRFTGTIDQRESETLNAWQLSFRLKQHHSTAEKIEQRQNNTLDVSSTDFKAVNNIAEATINNALSVLQNEQTTA